LGIVCRQIRGEARRHLPTRRLALRNLAQVLARLRRNRHRRPRIRGNMCIILFGHVICIDNAIILACCTGILYVISYVRRNLHVIRELLQDMMGPPVDIDDDDILI
jgi:hypothetical protein